MTLHKRDRALLEQLQSYFSGGGIYKHGPTTLQLRMESSSVLQAVLRHFDRYSLISQKQADYLLFKQAFGLFSDKEH